MPKETQRCRRREAIVKREEAKMGCLHLRVRVCASREPQERDGNATIILSSRHHSFPVFSYVEGEGGRRCAWRGA
jgi:hypothetical protein